MLITKDSTKQFKRHNKPSVGWFIFLILMSSLISKKSFIFLLKYILLSYFNSIFIKIREFKNSLIFYVSNSINSIN